jgi:3-oxoacyl-[acyl-carrier-protein] synthase II
MTRTVEYRRVVVTGIGVVSAIGIGKDPFRDALLAGRSGVRQIQRFDTAEFPVKIAAEVRDFYAQDFIDKKMSKRMDRYEQ